MGMPISLSHRSAVGQFFSLPPVTDLKVFAKVQSAQVNGETVRSLEPGRQFVKERLRMEITHLVHAE